MMICFYIQAQLKKGAHMYDFDGQVISNTIENL